MIGLHGSVMVSTGASQQGSWFESQLGPFCLEFACSPYASVDSV